MLLEDRIKYIEMAIVNHYTLELDEKRLGWTKLKDIQVNLDYIISDDQDWDAEYFKKLSSLADELKIPESSRYNQEKPKYKRK